METAKIWGLGIIHTGLGFVLSGAMFREYANNCAEVPAFIPQKYFYIAMGLAVLYCFSYTLSIPRRLGN